MTDRHCHVWLQKNISILGGVLQTFLYQFDDGILCTLSPNHNVYKENGVYQQWTTYTLNSKSVPGMYFPAIWRSRFTDLANSKKLNLWEITTVDKSARIRACIMPATVQLGLFWCAGFFGWDLQILLIAHGHLAW